MSVVNVYAVTYGVSEDGGTTVPEGQQVVNVVAADPISAQSVVSNNIQIQSYQSFVFYGSELVLEAVFE